MDGGGDLGRELGVADRCRRRGVQRARQSRVVDRPEQHPHLVLERDPARPLAARAEPGTEAEAERRQHQLEHAPFAEHDPRADADDADARPAGPGWPTPPRPGRPRQEAHPAPITLIHPPLAGVAVVADGRPAHEHPGRAGPSLPAPGRRVTDGDAALADGLFLRRRPPPDEGSAGEMDGGVDGGPIERAAREPARVEPAVPRRRCPPRLVRASPARPARLVAAGGGPQRAQLPMKPFDPVTSTRMAWDATELSPVAVFR